MWGAIFAVFTDRSATAKIRTSKLGINVQGYGQSGKRIQFNFAGSRLKLHVSGHLPFDNTEYKSTCACIPGCLPGSGHSLFALLPGYLNSQEWALTNDTTVLIAQSFCVLFPTCCSKTDTHSC